mgnify:CR=1 FL=1
MIILDNIRKKIFLVLFGIAFLSFCTSCGIYQPSDARNVPANAKEKVKKNLEEGRGVVLADVFGGGKSGTTYQFASSNSMWRASLEILDFLPLSNVDYSGGIISTDWYNEGTAADESIKITIRFLTNEVRADGLKIIIHKRRCNTINKCTVKKIESTLENELRVAILKKAIVFENERKKGKKRAKRKIKD